MLLFYDCFDTLRALIIFRIMAHFQQFSDCFLFARHRRRHRSHHRFGNCCCDRCNFFLSGEAHQLSKKVSQSISIWSYHQRCNLKYTQAHLFLAFEFDSNCQALGGLAVRVEFKCFVSAPFSIVFGAIFDRFRQYFRSFSVSFCFVFDRFRFVFDSF